MFATAIFLRPCSQNSRPHIYLINEFQHKNSCVGTKVSCSSIKQSVILELIFIQRAQRQQSPGVLVLRPCLSGLAQLNSLYFNERQAESSQWETVSVCVRRARPMPICIAGCVCHFDGRQVENDLRCEINAPRLIRKMHECRLIRRVGFFPMPREENGIFARHAAAVE